MWFKEINEGLLLLIKVVPGASRTEIVGLLGNRLKIKVAAPPEQGKANAMLISFLAELLGLKKSNISVKFGKSSPEKNIVVQVSKSEQKELEKKLLTLA
ncbi:MAG: DUF167 domain-containing protein [bacterium]|nr:DUF167 domain-containing protein [bacterium]